MHNDTNRLTSALLHYYHRTRENLSDEFIDLIVLLWQLRGHAICFTCSRDARRHITDALLGETTHGFVPTP